MLSEIGTTNNISVVSREELGNAMRAEVQRYPGQEKQVFDFFQKNPQALENLRSPIFEEKVVDFMLELAKVDEQNVTPEALPRPRSRFDPERGDLPPLFPRSRVRPHAVSDRGPGHDLPGLNQAAHPGADLS